MRARRGRVGGGGANGDVVVGGGENGVGGGENGVGGGENGVGVGVRSIVFFGCDGRRAIEPGPLRFRCTNTDRL